MKLIAKIKLLPTKEQGQLLIKTLQEANTACNAISDYAWEHEKFRNYDLHYALYHNLRKQFDLSAQVIVRCLKKVADAYKLDKKSKRTFKPLGGIAYDSRILKYFTEKQEVSIWAIGGRQRVAYAAGQRQIDLLKHQSGESDLVFHRGKWYLFATCDIPDPEPIDIDNFLGVDLGIANIATDSDGEMFSGSHVKSLRHHNKRLRSKLQRIGTKSAKRLLKHRSGKESRFAKDVNHVISKRIVDKAERTGQGIALENLKGILQRVRARRSQRYQLHSWSFHDLGTKILYKAALAGIPVVFVDPKYTSQECSQCGHIAKSNRKSQEKFSCGQCEYVVHADYNAALNIASRADVNLPNVGELLLAV